MKKQHRHKYIFLLLSFSFMLLNDRLIAQEDTVVKENTVKVHYFNTNNSVQYLLIESLLKAGKKTEPQPHMSFQVFLDTSRTDARIAKVVTDENGKARVIIPPVLKTAWDASPKHKFIVVPEAAGSTPAELEITKAKIVLDTSSADGTRNITVKVEQYEKDHWIPAKDVEMKIGVERQGASILSANDKDTYTTDSSGIVTVEFNKDSLPGDQKGNFVLVARVEDNDLLGNLLIEKNVSWGVPEKTDNSFFDQRTLWSARFRSPFWLLFTAYSIFITVWFTLIFLIIQFIKIRRLGRAQVSDT